MARNVNVWLTNWHWTGVEVPTPQAEVDITIHWTDHAGERKQHTETVKFPNVLKDVPVPWLKRQMTEWMLLALRKKLEMDPEPVG